MDLTMELILLMLTFLSKTFPGLRVSPVVVFRPISTFLCIFILFLILWHLGFACFSLLATVW